MGLFKNNYEKDLDAVIKHLEMNMSNNYKDAAQADFREFEEKVQKYINEGHIKGKSSEIYEGKLKDYRVKMQGYTHKDQKPYWT